MKRLIVSLVAGTVLVLAPTPALAGSCPPRFHLHVIGDGNHEHAEHQHAGLSMEDVDANGNGDICVKHIGGGGAIHVHIDDVIP